MKLIKDLFKDRRIRFLFVGGINTIVGYGSYTIFLLIGINYLIANVFSTIIGVINSYIWNRNFTFKSNKKISNELWKFILVYLLSFFIGTLILYILVDKFQISEYLAGILNLVITTLISYTGHKLFSFRKE